MLFLCFICLKLEESGKETTVQRVYEDFEWLQHCLATDSDVGGVIVSSWCKTVTNYNCLSLDCTLSRTSLFKGAFH